MTLPSSTTHTPLRNQAGSAVGEAIVTLLMELRRRADELEELLIESVDDPSDLDHERVKALEYSQAGIRPHTFAEDYARDHKRIHLHFWGCREDEGRDFCVVYQAGLGDGDERFGLASGFVIDESVQTEALGHRGDDREQFVLVPVVQSSQKGEGRHHGIVTLVRLNALDQGSGLSGKVDHARSAARFVCPLGVEDRELSECVIEIGPSKRPSDVVERAPQVVDAIADSQRPLTTGQSRRIFDASDVVEFVDLRLNGDSIEVRFKEGVSFSLERLEVLACPTKFGATSIKPQLAQLLAADGGSCAGGGVR